MQWKRTTVPDGIPGSPGPPPPADRPPAVSRRSRLGCALRVTGELARSGARLQHRPTFAQLRTMAALDGHSPASYPLDGVANTGVGRGVWRSSASAVGEEGGRVAGKG